jgi:CheY-like chemotaxis protein
LVEDNAADAGLIREALEEHGIDGELTVCTDGEAAIMTIEALEAQPDLIIVDLKLPRRSGHEVLECIRRSAPCLHVPVIVLSSSDTDQDRGEALRLGANRYIRKPIRLEEFIGLGAIFKAALGGRVQ